MIILFFLAEEGTRSAASESSFTGNLVAIFLFALMAAIIIGLGAIVGYKAFQAEKKKKQ